MRVLDIAQQQFGSGVDQNRAHADLAANVERPTPNFQSRTQISRAISKDEPALSDFAIGRSMFGVRVFPPLLLSGVLILLLANKRNLLALDHRAIDRDLGDIFAAG